MTNLSFAEHKDQSPAPSARYVVRPRRYEVEVVARLRVGTRLIAVKTLDISQGGVKLSLNLDEMGEPMETGTLVLINTACLTAPKLAKIVWQKDDMVGLVFREPLSVSEIECVKLREQSARL